MALNNIEMTELLFEAIDAIVTERLKVLPYDKTVVAIIRKKTRYEIIDEQNNSIIGYKYKVTTDDNITFDAYSNDSTYKVGMKVYVRIPQGDYTLLKVITQVWVPIYKE